MHFIHIEIDSKDVTICLSTCWAHKECNWCLVGSICESCHSSCWSSCWWTLDLDANILLRLVSVWWWWWVNELMSELVKAQIHLQNITIIIFKEFCRKTQNFWEFKVNCSMYNYNATMYLISVWLIDELEEGGNTVVFLSPESRSFDVIDGRSWRSPFSFRCDLYELCILNHHRCWIHSQSTRRNDKNVCTNKWSNNWFKLKQTFFIFALKSLNVTSQKSEFQVIEQ